MTYTLKGDDVILQMTREDYNSLLVMLGTACGAMSDEPPIFRAWLDFVNRLNATNPNYTPYEILEQFR